MVFLRERQLGMRNEKTHYAPVFALPFRVFVLRSRRPEPQWGGNPRPGRPHRRHPNRRPRSPRRWKNRRGGRSLRQHCPPPPPPGPGAPRARLPSQTSVIAMVMVTTTVLSTALEASALPDALRVWHGRAYLILFCGASLPLTSPARFVPALILFCRCVLRPWSAVWACVPLTEMLVSHHAQRETALSWFSRLFWLWLSLQQLRTWQR